MSAVKVNVRKVPDLRKPREAFNTATRESGREAGRILKKHIRAQIPPPKGAGKFPGYAATGKLQDAIVAQEPQRRARGGWQVRVGVQHTRRAAVYARIHNVGGVILPVKGKYLVFRNEDGKLIFAKRVRIKRKLYFSTGVKNAMPEVRSVIREKFIGAARIR